MTKILLLEDDIGLIDGLEYSLQKNGFDIETVRTVSDALNSAIDQSSHYDLLILDITLPDGTGFEVCEKVRQQNKQIPIIFLTASDEEVNIIRGLDCGGDDYITKPFKIGELCSRIRALLRRTQISTQTHSPSASYEIPIGTLNVPSAPAHYGTTVPGNNLQATITNSSVIISGSLTIDLTASRVALNGKSIELTKAEYRLLTLLVKNANQVVTREIILNELWDSAGDFVDDNTLSVYVRRLREKIEPDPSHPEHLTTVRGFGYRWKP
ncbi:MAG: response regulator transcription factor [Lachnospiraceae bacterium]|nr:response regulator transcription factor [Lachnospiraceae bacterium]